MDPFIGHECWPANDKDCATGLQLKVKTSYTSAAIFRLFETANKM